MARSNRNHGGRRDGRPQRSHTRERLREEVERRGGASAASSPAPQAADAGGGSAREGEASGFRVRGDSIDPRFAMFQAFSSSLMGSVRLREEMERRMREAMAGGFRDVSLGTKREWSPPCPYIPGADVSHKTSNGLLVVLDCTLFGDDWHEGMAVGLHECGTGRSGPPCPEPEPNNFCLVLHRKSDLRFDWDKMGFLREHLPPRRGPSRGGSSERAASTVPTRIGRRPRGATRSLTGLSGPVHFSVLLTFLFAAGLPSAWTQCGDHGGLFSCWC